MRALKSEDLLRMRWVRDPAMSPDGQQIAYVLKEVADDESYNYRLMLVNAGERAARGTGRELLPTFSGAIKAPQWSPDGRRLAFLSNHSGRNQVWMYDFETGQLGRLTDAALGVNEFIVSPDGSRIAFVGPVKDESGTYGEHVEGSYRVIKRLLYKTDGVGYWKCTWSHVWIVDCPDVLCDHPFEKLEAVQLTNGPHNHGSLTFSPDGKSLAFISSRDEDPDTSPFRDLFVLQLELTDGRPAPGRLEAVTSEMVAASPSYSPDGQFIAFIGHDNSDDRATNTGVWVTDGTRLVNLTADVDRPAGDLVSDDMNAEVRSPRPFWNEDGDMIITLMTDSGCTYPVSIRFPGEEAFDIGCAKSNLPDNSPEQPWDDTTFCVTPLLDGDRRVFAVDYPGAGSIAFAESTPHNPGELVSGCLTEDGAVENRSVLTALNEDLLSELDLAEIESINFTGSEGRTIGGWLLLPPRGEGPHPLVLHIHGGPHAAYSPAFNFELQHLASEGYAVLYTNPHGSHSYGRAINTGTRLDWGGKDYADLMKAVDVISEREDIDSDRVGVAGGSYGGWMTNFIVTQTGRFRAAVAQRPSSNRMSTFTSSAVGFRHARWEAPGAPWEREHQEYFTRVSPALNADKVTTPLLLVHAEYDHLCPLTQAEEMFTALKFLGKPVELLTFLGESHHMGRVGKPGNRAIRVDKTAEWFHRFV